MLERFHILASVASSRSNLQLRLVVGWGQGGVAARGHADQLHRVALPPPAPQHRDRDGRHLPCWYPVRHRRAVRSTACERLLSLGCVFTPTPRCVQALAAKQAAVRARLGFDTDGPRDPRAL